MKCWTYKGVTSAAEKNIRECMDKARRAGSESMSEMYRNWAYGAYSLWADITADEQDFNDWERLRRLAGID
ncbi:hypothetical protein A0E43_00250 [Pectobacterium cacticida]